MTDNGLLYHYTNQKGLMGIVENKEIWSTDLIFVNDSSEFKYAMNLMRGIVANKPELQSTKLVTKASDSQNARKGYFYDSLIKYLDVMENIHEVFGLCITSFSRQGDQLSQWRGYCQNGVGYSLGFDPQVLKQIAEQKKWRLEDCVYNVEGQKIICDSMVAEYDSSFEEKKTRIDELWTVNALMPDYQDKRKKLDQLADNLNAQLFNKLFYFAPVFKNPTFQEEEESRLIISNYKFNESNFKEGRGYLVPYVKAPLWNANNKFPLKEIIIGPCADPSLSKLSVKKFLEAHNLEKKCEIQISKIPYRNW